MFEGQRRRGHGEHAAASARRSLVFCSYLVVVAWKKAPRQLLVSEVTTMVKRRRGMRSDDDCCRFSQACKLVMTTLKLGMLYPGSMGSSLARLSIAEGAEVYTVVSGRSERTQRFAVDSECRLLESEEDLLRGVDVILSVHPPRNSSWASLTMCTGTATRQGARDCAAHRWQRPLRAGLQLRPAHQVFSRCAGVLPFTSTSC